MIKIPLDALKDKGEDDSEIMPEVGDEVTLGGATGIYRGSEGDKAMVELQSINGVPVEYGSSNMDKEPEDAKKPRTMPQERADLMKAARAADKAAGYED